MSHVLPAVACCCGTDPCGEPCCDQGTTEFSISWNGSFVNIFNSCECGDVPNFVCPCIGSVAINGGQVGRGTITRTPPAPLDPCGACSITLEAVSLTGIGNYNCPCACQWEDPPGSGNFVSCADNQNPLCGPFEFLCGVGSFIYGQSSGGCPEFLPELELKYDSSPNGQAGGRWEVVLPIRILTTFRASDCANADTTYCHPEWSRVFTPGENGVLFRGPQVTFCADGRVDFRSRVGGYVAHNVTVIQGMNQQLEWNPGTVFVS